MTPVFLGALFRAPPPVPGARPPRGHGRAGFGDLHEVTARQPRVVVVATAAARPVPSLSSGWPTALGLCSRANRNPCRR
jgi:hypothetical protein